VKKILVAWLVVAMGAGVATADLLFSLGVRETASAGPVGADGGTANGIEWIGLNSESVPADGLWHELVFDLNNDSVTAFAGTTANSVLASATGFGVFESLRIQNTADGVTHYRVWIDAIVNTVDDTPKPLTGFEPYNPGDEVFFQEPRFSGSTVANLLAAPDVAEVTAVTAAEGTKSYAVEFEFVDDDGTRWVRLHTFQTPNLPNPQIAIPADGFFDTSTVSLRVRVDENPGPLGSAPAVPAASTAGVALLAVLVGATTLAALRRRGLSA